MLTTTEEFLEAVHADVREATTRVLMYFDGDAAAPIELDDEDVVDFSLLEETHTNSRDPIGGVTSNECTLSLRNDDKRFSPANGESPLFGKLVPNVLFKVQIGIRVGKGFEYVDMGTFRTGDWDVSADGIDAYVTGTDKVYEITSKPIPDIPIVLNGTVSQHFRNVFDAVGLTPDDYIIDDTLTQVIAVGWLPDGDFIDVMRELAIAGNCSVFADRQNRIVVKSNTKLSGPVDVFNDESMINQVSNPQRIKDLYTGVKINYYTPQLVTDTSLYSLSDYLVPGNGSITLTDVEFSEAPVAIITKVVGSNLTDLVISFENTGAMTTDIVIRNLSGTERKVSFEVFGDRYQLNKLSYVMFNEAAKESWGERVYEVDNVFIQSYGVAAAHAKSLLSIVSDPFADVSIQSRGNPALEITDTIVVDSPTDNILEMQVAVLRNNIKYDGALSIDMDCRRIPKEV